MTADQALSVIHALDRSVLARARRLEMAMKLLRDGATRREASGAIQRAFGVHQSTAWRTVDMAHDMAGAVEPSR